MRPVRTRFTISTTQNCSAKSGVILVLPAIESGIRLFYESLADAVDKIGVGGSESGGAHGRRHLPAMMSRMRDQVDQDVVLAAAPGFTLAVLIGDGRGQAGFAAGGQVFFPECRQLGSLPFAFFGCELRPDGKKSAASVPAAPSRDVPRQRCVPLTSRAEAGESRPRASW